MRALKQKGYTVKWFDKRKSIEDDIDYENLFGLILNKARTGLFSRIWMGRHWIAFPNINGTYYDVNSSNRRPKQFENLSDVRDVSLFHIMCTFYKELIVLLFSYKNT